jgi:hypothetical protein
MIVLEYNLRLVNLIKVSITRGVTRMGMENLTWLEHRGEVRKRGLGGQQRVRCHYNKSRDPLRFLCDDSSFNHIFNIVVTICRISS